LLEDYGNAFDDEGRAKLETLPRLAQRMETLIDSLLHYSRVGRVDLAINKTDLGRIVADVCESLAISLQEARIEIRIPTPLPTIQCDEVRVGEIFHNLITNAMKYNDNSQKWIEIGVIDAGDEKATGTNTRGPESPALAPRVFYVRDNGIGIQEKHHEVIFRIFKRLHGRDKYQGGTGAGLTIVKKIVERHEGQIWIDSTPGEGSTFYFTLERERMNSHASRDSRSTNPAR
jgi:light-regulated signal transduction histidine kinase (bacteriophytochrome)